MLPVILAVVGAYLIGDSVLEDGKSFAKGGEVYGDFKIKVEKVKSPYNKDYTGIEVKVDKDGVPLKYVLQALVDYKDREFLQKAFDSKNVQVLGKWGGSNRYIPLGFVNKETYNKYVDFIGGGVADESGKKILAKGGEVNKFDYMMLDRLRSDNEYYLGYGNRNPKNLWAGSVDGQIEEMKKLWNQLPKDGKPEWLSMEDIEEYEKKMKGHKMADGGEVDKELIDSSAKSIYDKKGMMSLRNTFLQVAKADEDAGDKETADYRRKVVAEYQSKQPKFMAKGGKTQGYDDKEDERLAMEHGKMSKKDLDSTHARRDDARFEERAKMAKGGELPFDNSNLYLNGFGMDSNGNSVVKVSFPNQRAFSIQTNGVLKETNNLYTKNINDLTDTEKKTIEKEVVEYVKEFGSKEQKQRLKTYSGYMAKGGKLVGKQKNLDVNKNGKLDAEDFKILRGEKMAKGGQTSKNRIKREGNHLMHFEPYFEKEVIVASIDDEEKTIRPSHGYFHPSSIGKKSIKWANKNGYKFIQDGKEF